MSSEQHPKSHAPGAWWTRKASRQRPPSLIRIATVSAAALLGCGPGHAANVAYGEHYEQTYLAACMAADTAQTCSCMMQAIQEEISFAVFADLVELHNGQIDRDIQHRRHVEAVRSRCVR